MKIAADVGYGFTKALSETGEKMSFPSLAAPISEAENIDGIFAKTKHLLTVNGKSYLIGEAAQHHPGCLTLAGQTEKDAQTHDALLFAAVYLAGGGQEIRDEIAVGLPVAFYRHQRDWLQRRLQQIAAWVSVDGGKERHIAFSRVHVYPQGAAAILCAENLPKRGLALSLDVGTYTTEYMLFEMRERQPVPIPAAHGSVELGIHFLQQRLAEVWLERTGTPLPARMAQSLMDACRAGEPVIYMGRDIDLREEFQEKAMQTAKAIAIAIQTSIGDRIRYVYRTICAGGGAELMFPCLQRSFPCAELLADPVFANTRGYMKLMCA